MKAWSFLILSLSCSSTTAFLTTSSSRALGNRPLSTISSLHTKREWSNAPALQAHAISGGSIDIRQENEILKSSITVGVITALMGFVYGKILGQSVKTVWTILPNLIIKRLGSINPALFITGMCTMGGLLVGLLSLRFPSTFTVADFVSSFSAAPAKTLPLSGDHLLPLLLLSLVTSTFGFSVGPEAPMVCAGALIGASLSRHWYGANNESQETLAYAGAAGALTAFMGIPIAGSIFALELTCANAGLPKAGGRALAPSIISSISAITLIRGLLLPSKAVGGHFAYGTVGALSGRAMILVALTCGAGGAVIGTLFHQAVAMMKSVAWRNNAVKGEKSYWKRPLLVKTLIGLAVGIISTNYPQTLFWGEGSLQMVIDGQKTAFSATKHGLSDILTSAARVNPSVPFGNSAAAVQVGIAKLISIALACAGKFPGGIIFPLFFATAPLAHAFGSLIGSDLVPVAVFCLMGATQASVTRTPLATVLMLTLTASAATELSVMLPACMISSYVGVFLSRQLSSKSYFGYKE